MINWLENWAFNVYGGKVVARGAALASAWLIAHAMPAFAAKFGIPVPFTPEQITGGMLSISMLIFETVKKIRMANPNSPAIQTDATKPGASISAAAAALTPI